MAEYLIEGACESVDEPRLAVVVVHREHAIVRQVIAGGGDGFLREQVRLETQLACAGDKGERVGQGEQDEVVLRVVARQEGTSVIDVDRHAGVVIRLIRVDLAADLLDSRIDLDGIDMLRPAGERERDVGSGARTDNEDVVQRIVDGALVGPSVDGLGLEPLLDIHDVLVRDAIHLDVRELVDSAGVLDLGVDLVVGRPRDPRHERLDDEGSDDEDHGDAGDPGQAGAVEQPECDEGDDRPDP